MSDGNVEMVERARQEAVSELYKSKGQFGKYLTFKLGGEEYGLEILKVREIIGLMNITSVPQTPEYVRGVINLRGKVIPVVDLRVKFGMERIDESEQTCIIVVEVMQGKEAMPMGVLVDAVSEVLDIGEEQVEPTPSFGGSVQQEFILGMAKIDEQVKILLNIQHVMTGGELDTVMEATSDQFDCVVD